MAEFQDVIKHWGRMLDAHRHGESIAIEASVPADAFKDAKLVEEIVMSWAAEHPEPVYELWGEWFEKRGDLIRGWHNATNIQWIANTFGRLMCTPIPADIAEKLGIEPKEDT